MIEALIERLKISCLGLDAIDPLRLLVDDVIAALAQIKQEPVAWMHTKIDGVAVPHRPADLDKHPERWEALYKTPPPCPTCEALARTVMLDQTSHDTHPPQRTWVELTDTQIEQVYFEVVKEHRGAPMPWGQVQFGRALLEKFKEKNT